MFQQWHASAAAAYGLQTFNLTNNLANLSNLLNQSNVGNLLGMGMGAGGRTESNQQVVEFQQGERRGELVWCAAYGGGGGACVCVCARARARVCGKRGGGVERLCGLASGVVVGQHLVLG